VEARRRRWLEQGGMARRGGSAAGRGWRGPAVRLVVAGGGATGAVGNDGCVGDDDLGDDDEQVYMGHGPVMRTFGSWMLHSPIDPPL
jgi:hypothetical protein